MLAGLVATVGIINIPITQELFGFAKLSWQAQILLGGYSIAYVIAAELLKREFMKIHHHNEIKSYTHDQNNV
jgi:hypothetical protein